VAQIYLLIVIDVLSYVIMEFISHSFICNMNGHVLVYEDLQHASKLLAVSEKRDLILILIPCIIEYVEMNELNALNCILLYFSFTMAPTCFGKTMPSSGSDCVSF
jgi:hypothetical protein